MKFASAALGMVIGLSVWQVPQAFATEKKLQLFNTMAGKPALIMVQGKPKEVVSLSVTTPFKSTLQQKFQLSEKGVLQYFFPQTTLKGEYLVTAVDQSGSFFVTAGNPNFKKSKLELSDVTAFVGKTIDGSVVLVDSYSNALNGKSLEIVVKGSASISCKKKCMTNDRGMVFFTVTSNRQGLKELSVRDLENEKILFQEDLGFIPLVRSPKSLVKTVNPELFEEEDYIPVLNPFKARIDAQGNSDRNFWDFLTAQLVDEAGQLVTPEETLEMPEEPLITGELPELPESTLIAVTSPSQDQHFEILIGTDPKIKFEPEQRITANSAADFLIKSVDTSGKVLTNYLGKIHFSIDPEGPLVPSDYSFTELDQGTAIFELALVLPVGSYTLKVEDVINPSLKGELKIIASLNNANLNNTNVVLSLESPINGSFYSKTISVQGTTNTDNTEIEVKELGQLIKKAAVDQNKAFAIPIELADGAHQLEILARYVVDGSTTSTTVDFEIDKTPPVITKVNSEIPPTRAGNVFTMTVEAEKESTLKAFINNRAYEFVGLDTLYTLNAEAPLEPGDYPVHLQISDKFGNTDAQQNVATLTVTEPLKEVANLFGIPGLGTITLSWDPVKDAKKYEVKYSSLLGSGDALSTEKTSITIENLAPDISYEFEMLAQDASGAALSLLTKSKAITPLTPEEPVPEIHEAAELPLKHTNSGPEVYFLILTSIILLNVYGRLRKAYEQAVGQQS